jgi:hypothetical protein
MSGNRKLGRGLRRREKNANEAGAGRFDKPAPDARAASPEAHESLISRKTVAEVPFTGLPLGDRAYTRGSVAAPVWPRPATDRRCALRRRVVCNEKNPAGSVLPTGSLSLGSCARRISRGDVPCGGI